MPRAKAKPPTKPKARAVAVYAHRNQRVQTIGEPSVNLLAALARAASDPRCDPAKMRELFAIHKEIQDEEARVAFTKAYVALQDDLPTIDAKGRIEIEAREKGARTTRAQSTPYATYQEIHRITKPILRKHGFALWFAPEIGTDDRIVIRGHLDHIGGHGKEGSLRAPLETTGSKNNLQGAGSTLSYLKRYLAISLLNIISEAPDDKDDDGSLRTRLEPLSETQLEAIIEFGGSVLCSEPHLVKHMNSNRPKGHPEITKLVELPTSRFEEAMAALRSYDANRKAVEERKAAQQ
jgi:ERF superfamily